jgi:hypothetical protein
MASDKRVTLPPTALFFFSDGVPQCSDQSKVRRPNSEDFSRMGNEGCPNESPSVDDATGYSEEEEEATAVSGEEFL